MEWIYGVIAAVVILGIILVFSRSNPWQVLEEEKELTDEMSKKYDHLKSSGVRCRIKHQAQGHVAPGGASGIAAAGSVEGSVRLEVHKDDLGKAEESLEKLSFTPGARLKL